MNLEDLKIGKLIFKRPFKPAKTLFLVIGGNNYLHWTG